MSKTLYRLPRRAKIAGVCAGLADYFDLDATMVRLVFVIIAMITGGGIVILYIILAIILPINHAEIQDTLSEKAHILGKELSDEKVVGRARNYVGIGLLVFGFWLLMGQFWPTIFDIRWEYIWPILLIIAGLLIIIRKRR